MKKILLILITVMLLSGCTTPAKNFREKTKDWTMYGYHGRCEKVQIEGVECIICEAGSSGLALQCNFNPQQS